jgi:hypothetical protein
MTGLFRSYGKAYELSPGPEDQILE